MIGKIRPERTFRHGVSEKVIQAFSQAWLRGMGLPLLDLWIFEMKFLSRSELMPDTFP